MKILVGFLTGGMLLSAYGQAAIPSNLGYTAVLTPSGKIDTRYLDGDDGTGDIPLVWATLPAVSVLTNATGSINLCSTYLTQPGSPNADLTVESGYSLPSGFSLGSTNNCVLSWATPSTASVLMRIRATRAGTPDKLVISNEFRVEAVTPPVSDTTAPTIPTGCLATGNTGAVDFVCDASSDPYVGEAGTGVASYDICKNGTGCQNFAASASGLSKQITLTNLGALSPTPTCTQSGTNWTIVAAGDIDGTDDLGPFCGAQSAAGPNSTFMTVTVNAITNSANFAKGGLWIRDNLNANSRYIAIYAMRAAAGTVQIEVRYRPTDGGTAVRLTLISGITLPIKLKLEEVSASVFTLSTSSNGNDWTPAISSYSLPMATTKYWGMLGTATTGAGGATATFDLQQFNLNNVARFSRSYTTSTTGSFTFRANDVAGNHSTYGAGVTGTPTAPSVPAKKWHPGFYMQLLPGSVTQSQSTLFGYYDQIAGDTHIQGVSRRMNWAQMEGATAGDYTAGIADVQAHINKLKCLTNPAPGCVPKRLFVRVMDMSYNNLTGDSDRFPQYVRNNYLVQGNQSVSWCRWNPDAMDHFIAMWRAYAAAFDNEPYFEGIQLIQETAFPITGTPCNFSAAGLDTQLRRLATAMTTEWKKTNIIMSINFMPGGQTQINNLMLYLNTVQVGLGGPDMYDSTCSTRTALQSHLTYQGLAGGHDFRGEMPIIHGVDAADMGGNIANCTPDQIRDHFNDDLHGSHLLFPRNDFQGMSGQQWATGILPYIDNSANALTHTACPSAYTQGCDTN